jgi:hypothetical protein
VNKTIWRCISKHLTDAGFNGLVDIGTCNVHIVHNAFRYTLEAFGSFGALESDIEDFANGGARGVRGAIAPGRQREGAPKEGGKFFLGLLHLIIRS